MSAKTFASLLVLVCVVGALPVLSPEASAQVLVPCCEGGFKPNKRCVGDENCPNVCEGGFRDGRPCRTEANCPAACMGGDKDGGRCVSDGDCPGGLCGAIGSCSAGTCTALCERGRPPKTPIDPVRAWLASPPGRAGGEQACP